MFQRLNPLPQKLRRFSHTAAVMLLMGALLAELLLRLAGAGDFPLYKRDPELGYILRSGSGRFLNAYGWEVNEHGMGVAETFTPGARDIILVGDSIVHGGLFLDQSARLGPQLADALGQRVWPASAPSWALLTQVRYLAATLKGGTTQHIIFVTNSEDFTAMTPWQGEYLQPTRRPLSVLLHAAGSLSIRLLDRVRQVPPPPPSDEWKQELEALAREHAGRVTFVLHPMRAELPTGPDTTELRQVAPEAGFCDVASALSPAEYDDYIHLTRVGIRSLALAIARCLTGHDAVTSREGAGVSGPQHGD
jgi:hypothetical protein